jgi:PAS domain S-box-containing protein
MSERVATSQHPITSPLWNAARKRRDGVHNSPGKDTLKALVNAVATGVVYCNPAGVVTEINEAALTAFRLQREDVVGKSIFDLHPPDLENRIRKMVSAFQNDPQRDPIVLRREFFGRTFDLVFAPVKGSEGGFQGILVSLTDATEKRRLEQQNEKLQDELLREQKLANIGMLASGIAHNLNGPLSVIVGYLDLLYARNPQLEEVPLVLAQAERMKEIISNMMMKSRHEQDTRKRAVDLNILLQEELKFLEANLYFKNNIKKQYEFTRGIPLIYGFYSDFSQAFLNIINNAIDAMVDSPRKHLYVKTYYDEQSIYVQIADTGCGLTPEEIDKIFAPFYSTKPPVGENQIGKPCGTGLGLSSTRELVRKYGGEILVDGKPGEGARFTVVYPIHINRPPQTPQNEESSRDEPVETEFVK